MSCIHRVMALVLRDTCRATSPAALIRQWRGRRATTATRAATAALRRRGTRCCNGAIGSGCAVSRCAAATSRRLRRLPPRGPQPASDALQCSTASSGLYHCCFSLTLFLFCFSKRLVLHFLLQQRVYCYPSLEFGRSKLS